MSVYKAAGPFIRGVSAQPSAVPVYEGQTAAIQVSITLAANPNLTLGMYEKDFCYRPQRSCARLCFHRRLSFCSQGRGCIPAFTGADPPGQTLLGRHSLGTTPSWADTPWVDNPLDRHPPRRPLQRTVPILLECILVKYLNGQEIHWRYAFFSKKERCVLPWSPLFITGILNVELLCYWKVF